MSSLSSSFSHFSSPSSYLLRLGIIGRPNVGKSTFFNRLLGQQRALVYDAPGMTRDWQCYDMSLGSQKWNIYDTPGLESLSQCESIFQSIKDFLHLRGESTTPLFHHLLWIVDGKELPSGLDQEILFLLRKKSSSLTQHLFLGINKCENQKTEHRAIGEWSSFGFPLLFFSALHGKGMDEFFDTLKNTPLSSADTNLSSVVLKTPQSKESTTDQENTIALTIIGKPNVGKSSLKNVLLGCNRMKTGPEAGLTRDSVTTLSRWILDKESYYIRLTDTAGIPKGASMKYPKGHQKSNDQEAMSHLAWKDMQRALCFSHVTLVVVDASEPIGHQDLSLLKMAQQEKRCLVVVLNKWDKVEDPQKVFYNLPTLLDNHHLVPFSTKTLQGKEELQQCIVTRFDQWSQHVPTAPLNRWLQETLKDHTPPLVKGRRIKIRYVTQSKTKPPTFDFFGSQVSLLPGSYKTYLEKRLAEDFSVANPVLRFKSPKNPFIKK